MYWLVVFAIAIPLAILRGKARRKGREMMAKSLKDPNNLFNRYKGRYHLLVLYFLGVMAFCAALVTGLLYFMDYGGARSNTTINVEKCLEKPNFKQEGEQIIETIESPAVVLEKHEYKKSAKDKGTYSVRIELTDPEANGMKVEVPVTQEEFEKISENDLLHLTRTVYYTLNGVRLNYEDKLSGGKL